MNPSTFRLARDAMAIRTTAPASLHTAGPTATGIILPEGNDKFDNLRIKLRGPARYSPSSSFGLRISVTSNLSILRPSISTISNRQPLSLNASPSVGRCFRIASA